MFGNPALYLVPFGKQILSPFWFVLGLIRWYPLWIQEYISTKKKYTQSKRLQISIYRSEAV